MKNSHYEEQPTESANTLKLFQFCIHNRRRRSCNSTTYLQWRNNHYLRLKPINTAEIYLPKLRWTRALDLTISTPSFSTGYPNSLPIKPLSVIFNAPFQTSQVTRRRKKGRISWSPIFKKKNPRVTIVLSVWHQRWVKYAREYSEKKKDWSISQHQIP